MVNGAPHITFENDSPPLRLVNAGQPAPRPDEVAVARITRWPTLEQPAEGELLEVLGERDLPRAWIFRPPPQIQFARRVPARGGSGRLVNGASDVLNRACANRETFFDRRVFTIDGADAKDFDDAVSLEKRPGGGWRLGRAYRRRQPLRERRLAARRRSVIARGTSVYLKSAVIPMLPFALSDHLCSLVPGQVRLTLSCLMDIDTDGRITGSRLCESAIRSNVRFTYDTVEQILKGEPLAEVPADIQEDVREMGRLALLLRKLRFARGSLDFDFPEPEVRFDAHGRPTSIQSKMRLESHKLVEDFMLAANESVARRS